MGRYMEGKYYMKKKLLLTVMVTLALFLTGCEKSPKLSNGEEVVVEINGKQFTTGELYEKLKKSAGATVLINMVDEYIANLEITDETDAKEYADTTLKRTKLQFENEGENFALALLNYGYENEAAYHKELLVNYKKNEVVENYYRSSITDKEIEKYYKDEVAGDITARHILITPDVTDSMTTAEKTAAELAALTKAKDLIKQLDEGADFAELAKEHSVDGSASEGGLLGSFNKQSNFVQEFLDASYALESGKYSKEPVKSQYGYHIILKESEKEKPSLDEIKNNIIDILTDEKTTASDDASSIAWKAIRIKYNINIIDTYMKNIYESAISEL